VRLSVTQVWRHAGVEAAAGAMVALSHMLNCGEAQFVDVSAQSVMTWTMLNAMDAYAIQGYDFERAGSVVNTARMRAQIQHPTADGYVIGLPFSDIIRACLPGMIEEGIADESIMDIDWDEYDLNTFDPDAKPLNLAQGTDMCQRYFAPRNKRDLFEFGLQEGVTLAPVNTLTELLDLEHIQFREYWHALDLPDGTAVHAPGLWAKTSSNQLSVRREAPGLDADGNDIRRELNAPAADRTYPAANPEKELPFAGLKVADFAWVGVGPISAKYLADHGATVVRVESEGRPDVLRANGPFKDDEPGLDRSQFFGDFNTSKRSFSLDLKSKEGIELARKLIAQSDVFIESFAPGAIERMGLTYDEVSELNPGLIMVSTCLMGQTGPARALAGYGYHAAAIAGFYEVTGWPDLEPSGPWVAYTDTIAPRFVSTLLGAVLDHRRRTGEGCYVDLAQIETALHFLGPELLDLQANGTTYTRMGNRGRYAAPQGCYPCAGNDRWCAISVDTDEQWQNLCREMGRDDWASDAAFATNTQRLGDQERIDTGIAEWSINQEPVDLMQRLQAAGVPAGVVQRSSELLADPQYAHRNFYRYHEHPVMGKIPYAGHQYRISGYDNAPRGPAPTLGQHSFEVLSELLGFSDEEIAAAYANGAVN
jgi:benzylsuccinate CoA-transferase BbsF subunit